MEKTSKQGSITKEDVEKVTMSFAKVEHNVYFKSMELADLTITYSSEKMCVNINLEKNSVVIKNYNVYTAVELSNQMNHIIINFYARND